MNIFISYRRNDSADVTGRIYDRLILSFGKDAIFKDVDSIPFGVNFRTYLSDIIEKSKVLLVVIGPRWLSITNDQGEKRLDDPADFVRIEIETALMQKIMVIPLLVGGAVMPTTSQLPSTLEELAFYNGIQIRHDPDFHKDMNRLIHELGGQIKHSGPEGLKNYYPESDLPEKHTFGNILERPPVETISIAKEKFVDFIHFLPTLQGRLLSGIVLGVLIGLVLQALAFGYLENLGLIMGMSFGISGLISYPHRKTIKYFISGTLIATTIILLMAYVTSMYDNYVLKSHDLISIIFIGLCIGTMSGAIVSRIQHMRKII